MLGLVGHLVRGVVSLVVSCSLGNFAYSLVFGCRRGIYVGRVVVALFVVFRVGGYSSLLASPDRYDYLYVSVRRVVKATALVS